MYVVVSLEWPLEELQCFEICGSVLAARKVDTW